MIFLTAVLLLLIASARSNELQEIPARPDRLQGSLRGLQDGSFWCELVQVRSAFAVTSINITDSVSDIPMDEENSLVCLAEGDIAYDIFLPDDVLEQVAQATGRVFATIVNAPKDDVEYQIHVDKADDIALTFEPSHLSRRRRTAKTMGKNSLLVVRVSYFNHVPSVSLNQLRGIVFGEGPQAFKFSLVRQIEDCSAGKLQLVPARGGPIRYGMLDIKVTARAVGFDSARTLENLAVNAVAHRLGATISEKFDHVMFVLPDGFVVGGKTWIGYGYSNSWRTVFNDRWAGYLSLLAHETGHNFNLAHAGLNKDEYGDKTGYMGYSVAQTGAPRRCYNAQNHWNLGWYNDRALSLSLEDLPWSGYLTAFPHYNLTGTQQHVLISMEATSPRLFVQYNRATWMNAESWDYADQVVIVKDYGGVNKPSYQQTWLEAGIAKGIPRVASTHRVRRYDGKHYDLVFEVCNTIRGPPDMVQLNIYLDKGPSRPSCGRAVRTGACSDDDQTLFLVDGKHGYHNCRWLRDNLRAWGQQVCDHRKSSYHICEKTCGKCKGNCADSPSRRFFVNHDRGWKDCEWLAGHPSVANSLCHRGHKVYDLCPKTCKRCNNHS